MGKKNSYRRGKIFGRLLYMGGPSSRILMMKPILTVIIITKAEKPNKYLNNIETDYPTGISASPSLRE